MYHFNHFSNLIKLHYDKLDQELNTESFWEPNLTTNNLRQQELLDGQRLSNNRNLVKMRNDLGKRC